MSKYRIEKIGKDQFELLVPLMKDCFSMEVNLEYFQWKYLDNPAGSFIGFIAVDNDTNEVGAYYGVIPQQLVINGTEQTIYQSCDTMTHSKHRRQGLFKMLALECYAQLRREGKLFIIGFGGADSTPGFLKFGWKHVFDFRYYFKPALLCRTSLITKFPLSDFSETATTQNLEKLLRDVKMPAAIHSSRTARHILWRSKNNNYQYQFVFYGKDSMEGYALYYVQDNKMILFDFIFKTKRSAKALNWFLCQKIVSGGYRGIIAYCQENGQHAAQLRQLGFISNPFRKGPLKERTPFIFYAEKDVMENLNHPAKWAMTSYDHDAL